MQIFQWEKEILVFLLVFELSDSPNKYKNDKKNLIKH